MHRSKTLLASAMLLALTACTNYNSTNTDGGSGELGETPNVAGVTDDRTRGIAATTAGDVPAGVMPGASVPGTSALAAPDRNALMMVMEIDRHEIAASNLALARNVDEPLRQYAQTLRDDHTRTLESAQRLLAVSSTGSGTDSGSEMGTVAGGTAATAGSASTGESDAMPDGAMEAAADPALVAQKRSHDAQREELAALQGDAFETAWIEASIAGHRQALTSIESELVPAASDGRVHDHLQTMRQAITAHLDAAQELQQRR